MFLSVAFVSLLMFSSSVVASIVIVHAYLRREHDAVVLYRRHLMCPSHTYAMGHPSHPTADGNEENWSTKRAKSFRARGRQWATASARADCGPPPVGVARARGLGTQHDKHATRRSRQPVHLRLQR